VAVRDDGGTAEIGADEGLGSAAYRDPRVHLTVRGEPHEPNDTSAKAWEIYGVLHSLTGTVLGSTRYDRIDGTTPVEVGQDGNARPLFTVAFSLAVAQGAPA
jgi:hypothetical protein